MDCGGVVGILRIEAQVFNRLAPVKVGVISDEEPSLAAECSGNKRNENNLFRASCASLRTSRSVGLASAHEESLGRLAANRIQTNLHLEQYTEEIGGRRSIRRTLSRYSACQRPSLRYSVVKDARRCECSMGKRTPMEV